MESAWETRPWVASEAPASKRVQEGSKSQRRRWWRKARAKGEWAEAGSSTEGTLDILRETGDRVD